MFKKKITESKIVPRKKNLDLKNISVENLKLVDTDTGEDITDEVVTEIPDGITTVDFKLTFEIPDDEE
jgi:hypothetical protein